MTVMKKTSEATVRRCLRCTKPLPVRYPMSIHISCASLSAEQKAQNRIRAEWLKPESIEWRQQKIQELNRARWIDYVVKRWEKNQAGQGNRVKMRALHGMMRANETEVLGTSVYFATKRAGTQSPKITGEYHCYVCETYHPAQEFYRDRTRSSGLMSKCKAAADIRRNYRASVRGY